MRWPERTVEERFREKVGDPDDRGCMPWTAGMSNGYGKFRWRRPDGSWTQEGAHRVAYALAHGLEDTPDGLVCHHCDNPPCVNPEHLYLGTPQTNVADMISRGRQSHRHGPPLPRDLKFTVPCDHCGGPAHKVRAQLAKEGGNYCSNSCSNRARAQEPTLTCPHCPRTYRYPVWLDRHLTAEHP